MPEQDHGAEDWVVGDAGEELEGPRPLDHLFDGEAGKTRLRRPPSDLVKHLARCALNLRAGQIEAHAANVRFVHDVGRQDLDRDAPSDLGGDPGGLGGVASSAGVDGRDGVGLEDALCLRFVQ